MIKHIDLSDGQIAILHRVVEIYNKNLAIVYKTIAEGDNETFNEISQLVQMDRDEFKRTLEEDSISFLRLFKNAGAIAEFDLTDLIIVQFIIREWTDDEKWDHLEVMLLINKLNILMELNRNKNQILLS